MLLNKRSVGNRVRPCLADHSQTTQRTNFVAVLGIVSQTVLMDFQFAWSNTLVVKGRPDLNVAQSVGSSSLKDE